MAEFLDTRDVILAKCLVKLANSIVAISLPYHDIPLYVRYNFYLIATRKLLKLEIRLFHSSDDVRRIV